MTERRESMVRVCFINGDCLTFKLDVGQGPLGREQVGIADARVLRDTTPVQGTLMRPTGEMFYPVWTRVDPEHVVGIYLTER
jgi:hypothetical protein